MNEARDRLAGPFLILGLSIVAAALIVSGAWRDNRKAAQTVNVVGSAKQEIVSDLGIFRCQLRGEGPTAEAAYRSLAQQRPHLLAHLAQQGFPEQQVRSFTVSTWQVPEYVDGRETGRILRVVYTQRFEIRSPDVKLIEKISLEIPALVEQGVAVEPEAPDYHFTGLAELKIEVQALAAQDAMNRARKIAAASDARLGPIRSARMGVLQITPRHSNMVSDYGINDLSSIEKEITAVVNASFSIK